MSIAVSEQTILESLRQVPPDRWAEVLRFLDGLNAEPPIQTGADLAQSGLVGTWSDRVDLGDGHEFARSLRREAEARQGAADAPGH